MCGQCRGTSCSNAANIEEINVDGDTIENQLLVDELYDIDNE